MCQICWVCDYVFTWILQNYFKLENRSADGNQAVALRIDGDRAMFYKVYVFGYQDTLLDNTGTHYFYKCFIQGIVDFIFGRAKSLYQVWNQELADYFYYIYEYERE